MTSNYIWNKIQLFFTRPTGLDMTWPLVPSLTHCAPALPAFDVPCQLPLAPLTSNFASLDSSLAAHSLHSDNVSSENADDFYLRLRTSHRFLFPLCKHILKEQSLCPMGQPSTNGD